MKETQKQRAKRRFEAGLNNPKKDKWARRMRYYSSIKPKIKNKPIIMPKNIPTEIIKSLKPKPKKVGLFKKIMIVIKKFI